MHDLTDPAHGPHAVQLVMDDVLAAVARRWPGPLRVHRGEHVVDIADNYDRLGYSRDAKTRDARYTRYVDETRMLRSQTSALVPGGLRALARDGAVPAILACPGMVYRRDVIDRLHTGTPHQLDVWPIGTGERDVLELAEVAVTAALPGVAWRTRAARHPYTTGGVEIEAWDGTTWVEIGEGGVAAARVLRGAGLTPYARGLALGLGLDRLVMLRKGIADIRLLRSTDPRVARQLTDLSPYRPVSAQPAARRDVSVAMPAGVTAEEIGDRVREVLGADAHLVEEVTLLSVTPAADLPAASRERLGINGDEVNALVRIVLRDLRSSLPRKRVNALRDRLLEGLSPRSHRVVRRSGSLVSAVTAGSRPR
jgi:phenylalanyl-tRNA synthetase alpha chain